LERKPGNRCASASWQPSWASRIFFRVGWSGFGALREIRTEDGSTNKAAVPPDDKSGANGRKVVLYVQPEVSDIIKRRIRR